MSESTDRVVVVGAGPVGLITAIVLAERGIAATVVDAAATPATTSRAAVIHARTLEVLAPHGVTSALVDRGLALDRFTIRDRDRTLVPVPFGGLPTDHPYTLMLSQNETEAVLRDRLAELGGSVTWSHAVRGVEQGDSGAVVTFDDGTNVTADYVVGADGMHSTVRAAAEIPFVGGTYDESLVLADVRVRGGLPTREVVLYFSPAGMMVAAPLPGGIHRIVAAVDDAPKEPGAEYVQRLLDTRGPRRQRATVDDVLWGSRFRVHHRVAETFRRGRLLLAGDAAHVHSPAGGQGMNLGLEDGVLLGTALARVLEGGPDTTLDEYATTRPPVAREVVRLASRLTTLATATPRLRPFRNLALTAAGRVPAVHTRLARELSGLNRRG